MGITSIADLFASPATPSLPVKFRQGVIQSFDPNTLMNTVKIGTTTFLNLPLLGISEASAYQANDVVGILVIGDDGGAQTYSILGKMVTPNTPQAIQAVTLLNQQIFASEVSGLPSGEVMPTGTFGDCATIGPQVTVDVGPSGRLLCIGTCQMQNAGAGVWTISGQFGLQMDGANVHVVDTINDPFIGTYTLGEGSSGQAIVMVAVQEMKSGLNPGNTILTMKYRQGGSSTVSVNTFRRTLTVIKL